MNASYVSYDRRYGLAMFIGPHGFTQVPMAENQATAIAITLGLPFRLSRPGTTLTDDDPPAGPPVGADQQWPLNTINRGWRGPTSFLILALLVALMIAYPLVVSSL